MYCSWARRCMVRLRLYHAKRRNACIIIQCSYRMHFARCVFYRVFVEKCTGVIQRCLLRYVWKVRLHKRLLCRMAVRIQCLARCLCARRCVRHLFRERCACVIQRWYLKCRVSYRLKSAISIQRYVF